MKKPVGDGVPIFPIVSDNNLFTWYIHLQKWENNGNNGNLHGTLWLFNIAMEATAHRNR